MNAPNWDIVNNINALELLLPSNSQNHVRLLPVRVCQGVLLFAAYLLFDAYDGYTVTLLFLEAASIEIKISNPNIVFRNIRVRGFLYCGGWCSAYTNKDMVQSN